MLEPGIPDTAYVLDAGSGKWLSIRDVNAAGWLDPAGLLPLSPSRLI
jgi:hypothetical protein